MLIEEAKIKDRFPVLFFYSNWICHNKITKGLASDILTEMSIGCLEQDLLPFEKRSYAKMFTNSLKLESLIDNMIDFIYYSRLNMPFIEYENKPLSEEEALKYLILNGNLDVSIPFIKKGNKSRQNFLLATLKQLQYIKLEPNLNKTNITKVKSFYFSKNPNSVSIIIKSFEIYDIIENKISIKMATIQEGNRELIIEGSGNYILNTYKKRKELTFLNSFRCFFNYFFKIFIFCIF